jgi:mitogen-activated protein kinase kinase kinase
MAVLAHKVPVPGTGGMGSAGRDYTPSTATHRMPVSAAAHNSFTSPTESEFSEGFEGPDSVR